MNKSKRHLKIFISAFLLFVFGLILFACKKDIKRNVKFDFNGGKTGNTTETYEIKVKDKKIIPAEEVPQPKKTKYKFIGWELEGALFDIANTKIEKDITLKAKWEELFSLKLSEHVSANISDLQNIEKGTKVILTIAVPQGEKLYKFFVNNEDKKASILNNRYELTINEDIEIKAHFVSVTPGSNVYQDELNAEFAKLEQLKEQGNGKIKLDNEVNLDSVKEKIKQNVDLTKFEIEVSKIDESRYSIKITHKSDASVNDTKEYVFFFIPNEDLTALLSQLDGEIEKINAEKQNEFLKIESLNPIIQIDDVKNKIENIVDPTIARIEVAEIVAGTKYEITLIHVDNENAKKTIVLQVEKILPSLKLELPSEVIIETPIGLDLNKVPANTEITIVINLPFGYQIDKLWKNTEEVDLNQVVNNKYTFIIVANTVIRIEKRFSDEIIQTIQTELDKVVDFQLVQPDGNITEEMVKNHIETLIDTSKVLVEVEKTSSGKFSIKLKHKTLPEASLQKEITVSAEQVEVSINLGGKATFNGEGIVKFNINKGSILTIDQMPNVLNLVYTEDGIVWKSWKVNNLEYQFTDVVNENINFEVEYSVSRNVTFEVENDKVLNRAKYNKVIRALDGGVLNDPFKDEPIVLPAYKFIRWVKKGTAIPFEFNNTAITENIVLVPEFETDSYLRYETVDGGADIKITGVNNNYSDAVYIPEELNGKTIVAIGYRAFAKSKITKVFMLGESLKEIHFAAFYGANFLKEVILGTKIEQIAEFAFFGTEITKIKIPASVQNIGHKAFDIPTLSEVVIENTDFRAISKRQFENSKWIQDGINTNSGMLIVNGVLVAVKKDKAKDLIIPSNVLEIGEFVFKECDATSITFSEGLETIGKFAFYKAKLPQVLKLPKSLKYISYCAFAEVKELADLSFEANSELKYIRAEAFKSAESLVTVVLPEGLKEVGDKSFLAASKLENITFPSTLVKFGYKAFAHTRWYIKESNKSHFIVANETLLDASDMTAADMLPNVKGIAKGAFFTIKNVSQLVIPDSVEFIDSKAFYRNGDIEIIKLPGTIKKIEKNAFIFETYYKAGVKDQKHMKVLISDIDARPSTWNENWYQIREQLAEANTLVTFEWAYEITINFELDGGSVSTDIPSQVLSKGGIPAIPNVIPEKDGKTFIGWYIDGIKYDFATPLTSAKTLTAKYVDNNPDYELAFENNSLVFVRLLNKSLTDFVIPDDVEGSKIVAIRDDAFNGATELVTLTIGQYVEKFGRNAFKGTKWLENKRNIDKQVIVNNVLVDAKNLEATENLKPEVKVIESYAFEENTKTKRLKVNVGCTTLNSFAFTGAGRLLKIELSQTVLNVKANAFAIGGSNNVLIDAEKVSHIKPKTWEDGYDNGDGAILTFKWKQVTTHSITLKDGITLTDSTLYPNAILDGSMVEIKVATKQYYTLSKFEINGEDKLAELVDNKITIQVIEDITFDIEYKIDADIENEVRTEYNKIGDKVGYVTKSSDVLDDIKQHLLDSLDTNLIDIEVEASGSQYNIKVISKKVDSYILEKTVDAVMIAKIQRYGSGYSIFASGYVNGNEAPEKAFDLDYRSKWCDNSSSNKAICNIFNEEKFVAKIAIAHASKGGESESMNTGKFRIQYYENNNWHDWVVVTNNKKGYTEHCVPGRNVRGIKLVIDQAEFSGDGAARIYEIEIFTEAQTVKTTFNLNGGNINGSTENVVKNMLKGHPLELSSFPQPVRENYNLAAWTIDGRDFMMGYETLEKEKELIARWVVKSSVQYKLDQNLEKIASIVCVTKAEATALEIAEIKAHIDTLVDLSVVGSEVTKLAEENKYKVKLILNGDDTVFVEKEITVLKKAPGEKVKLTLSLNGGKYNDQTDDQVIEFDKGYIIKDSDIENIERDYYDFGGWYINNIQTELEGYIIVENVTAVAKWDPTVDIQNEVDEQIQNIPDELGFDQEDPEVSLDTLKNKLETLIDPANATVQVENAVDEYKFTVRVYSSKATDFSLEKEVHAAKNILVELDEYVSLKNTEFANKAILGTTVRIRIQLPGKYAFDKFLINNEEQITQEDPYSGYERYLDYDVVANEKIVTKLEYSVNAGYINQELEKVAQQYANGFIADTLVGLNEVIIKEKIEETIRAKHPDIEVLEVARNDGNGKWNVTIAHNENTNTYKKVFEVDAIVETTLEKAIKLYPYSGWGEQHFVSPAIDNEHSYSKIFDRTSDGQLDLSTAFVTKDRIPGWDGFGGWIMYGFIVDTTGMGVTAITSVKIYYGGAMPGGSADDNVKDLAMSYRSCDSFITNNSWSFSGYGDSVKNNTENYNVFKDKLTGSNKWQFQVNLRKSNAQNKSYTISGTEVYGYISNVEIKFDINGGMFNGNAQYILRNTKNKALVSQQIPAFEKQGKTIKGYEIDGEIKTAEEFLKHEFTKDTTVKVIWND